jgi:hypothetical protein
VAEAASTTATITSGNRCSLLTSVKVSSGPVSGGNVLSVVGSSVRDVITINGSTTSVDVWTGTMACGEPC